MKTCAIYYHKCTSVFMYSTRYYCQILMNFSFLDRVSKNTRILNFTKIHPMEQSFPYGRKDTQVARRTDMGKLIVAFHNFANAPKNCNTKTGTKISHIYNTKISRKHNTKISRKHNTKISRKHNIKISRKYSTKISRKHNMKISRKHNAKNFA